MALAVAFAGKIGCGKTSVSNGIAGAVGWPRASFGDYVRQIAKGEGLTASRRNLQVVGTQLLERDMKNFCAAVLSSSGWQRPGSVVIDGLRHRETIPILQEIVSPAKLKIVFIKTTDEIRLQRLTRRDSAERAEIRAAEAHSSEQQVSSALQDVADLVIDGDRPIQDILREVVAWLRTFRD